ncbi:MAG: DUF4870 domain-containing protein [Planctomycetia bacterium]
MSVADELLKLQRLHQSGAIDADEFAEAKARLLSSPPPLKNALSSSRLSDTDDETWALLLHLSQFAGYAVPLAGLIVPILIWQLKKADVPTIDAHGKVVANWIISEFIYLIVCFLLVFVFVGIPLLFVLGILGLVFPVIGAIKAKNGEVWRYPLSIPFFT